LIKKKPGNAGFFLIFRNASGAFTVFEDKNTAIARLSAAARCGDFQMARALRLSGSFRKGNSPFFVACAIIRAF
jgi:hypothetical protein